MDKPILPTPYELQYLILLDSNISSNEDSYVANNIYIIIYSCTLHLRQYESTGIKNNQSNNKMYPLEY